MRDRGMRHRGLIAALAAAGLALALTGAAGATERAKLSPAEQTFAKAYKALVPGLTKVHDAIIHDVENAGKLTDAQIVTVFTGVAKQWTAATKPLVALKAPAPEAGIFATIRHDVPLVEADLLALANAGRTHSVSAAKTAVSHLVRDFNGTGAAVKALNKKLGVS